MSKISVDLMIIKIKNKILAPRYYSKLLNIRRITQIDKQTGRPTGTPVAVQTSPQTAQLRWGGEGGMALGAGRSWWKKKREKLSNKTKSMANR